MRFLPLLYFFPFVFLSQLFGCGSVAQTVLSKGAVGEPLTIHVGFTLGVMMAVYIAGGVSGMRSTQRVKLFNRKSSLTITSYFFAVQYVHHQLSIWLTMILVSGLQ